MVFQCLMHELIDNNHLMAWNTSILLEMEILEQTNWTPSQPIRNECIVHSHLFLQEEYQ